MHENIPISSGASARDVRRTSAKLAVAGPEATKLRQDPAAPVQGAAFAALIEKLEVQARELAERSLRIESPADLAGAVDRAHASLQDALSLSDRLLEAYRQSLLERNGGSQPR